VQAGESCLKTRLVGAWQAINPAVRKVTTAGFNICQEGTIKTRGVISQIYVSAHDPDVYWCEGVDREVLQFAAGP